MSATSSIPEKVRAQFTDTQADQLIALRRDLHQNPELSFQEERTSQRLLAELEKLNPISIERVAKTGLIARIKGRDSSAPLVAIRGDIDALPIQEETGLEYASNNEGVMHACGHDVHAAWAIGAAQLLTQEPAAGDVLVLLQPAEEIGEGALAVIESGGLSDVKAIFGGHVDRRFRVGQVVVQEGPIAASADAFTIVLNGVGAHGARPHESRDPVVGLGALINAIQTIVSRRLNPAHPGVVTIGTVHGGTASNVIPASVSLSGTLRAVDPDTRGLLASEIQSIAKDIAKAYGLDCEVEIQAGPPPIMNPPEATAMARSAVSKVLGEEAITPLGFLNMGGEDFAFYMESIPGSFMRIGAREPNGEVIPAHSPHFHAAESCIFVGAAVLAECAREASACLAAK